MPLDTSLALQVQPPADPLERYGKVLALKNAIQQGKSQDLALQSQQLDLDDQQKMRQAFQASGGDLTALEQNAIKLGVGPKTLMQLKDSILKQRESIAKLDTDEFDLKQKHVAAIGSAAQSILQLPTPEARAAAYPQARAALLQSGIIKPEELPEQYPGDDQIQQSANVARTSQQILDSVAKEREAKIQEQNAASTAANATTNAARETREGNLQARKDLGAKLGATKSVAEYADVLRSAPVALAQEFAGKTPEQARQMVMTGAEQASSVQSAANAEQAKKYQAGELAQGAARIAISKGDLDVRNKEYQQKYGDVLGNLPPDKKDLADKIAHGDFNPAQLSRFPDKEQLIQAAIQINPAWSQATYDTKQSFTNPEKSQAKNLGTISRIVGHIGRFEGNSKDLGFAPAYAAGVNLTGSQNKLNEDAHAIAGELEKLVSGGVGSMEQTRAWQKSLSSPSADARQKAVDEISQLIGSQYEGMNQTYKAAIGSDIPIEKYVSGPGREWLKSKGINVTGAAEPAAKSSDLAPIPLKDGTSLTPHSAADAARFRKDHANLIK